jgi:hypothetical protein
MRYGPERPPSVFPQPPAFDTPQTPGGSGAAVVGEIEPQLGLGARLAALQAVSGEFATVPVDSPDGGPGEAYYGDDERPSRGMWEPKVPAATADAGDAAADHATPAHDPGPTRGDPGPSAYEPTRAAHDPGRTSYDPARASYEPVGAAYHEPSGAAYHEPSRAAYDEPSGAAYHEPSRAAYDPGPAEYRPEPSVHDLPPLEPVTVEPTPAFAIRNGADSSADLNAFEPANSTEEDLLVAARDGNTDGFLSTLLLAKVLVPGHSPDPDLWPVEEINEGRYLVAFTSPERLAERPGSEERDFGRAALATVRFTSLIARWPSDDLGFAVNPGTPLGARLTGEEVRTLAVWAAEVGLIERDQEPEPPEPEPAPTPAPAARPEPRPATGSGGQPLLMQRTIAAAQVSLYLDRGYDRVSGFVHRASEVDHLRTPVDLYRALGLVYPGSQFNLDDAEVYVLRWPAHCPSLYRIPFGGQTEAGMHAMQGWVIERAPFRGNGFAPSETGDVVAEFKIDSTRLPHGTQLWRLTRDGTETLVALFDADGPRWRRVGEGSDA